MAQRPDRLLAEARLLLAWGQLLALGITEERARSALAAELGDDPLSGLCDADPDARARALEEAELSSWVRALLSVGPRRGPPLTDAGRLLVRQACEPWRRGWLWRKLLVLHEGGVPPAEALGPLAREARDQGLVATAEALYGAARAAREGADLRAALLGAASACSPLEELVLARLSSNASLAEVLGALAEMHDLPPSPPTQGRGLEDLAQAASERAAPLRRGLDRVLTRVEDVLGIQRGPSARAGLARETVQARAAGGEPAPSPPEQPPAAPADQPPPRRRAEKTIGGDSTPVPLAERGPAETPLEAWALAFEDAQAQLTLLELQPGEAGAARELRAALRTLRADLVGELDTPRRRAQLDDLELRFVAWDEEHRDA